MELLCCYGDFATQNNFPEKFKPYNRTDRDIQDT